MIPLLFQNVTVIVHYCIFVFIVNLILNHIYLMVFVMKIGQFYVTFVSYMKISHWFLPIFIHFDISKCWAVVSHRAVLIPLLKLFIQGLLQLPGMATKGTCSWFCVWTAVDIADDVQSFCLFVIMICILNN